MDLAYRVRILVWSVVFLNGCQLNSAQTGRAPTEGELIGFWQVHTIGGESVATDSRANIQFSKPPRLTGNASCNRFFGVYHYRDSQLDIDGELGAGKILCRPSLMGQENKLLSLLPLSVGVHLNDDELILLDESGNALVKAQRVQDGKR